MPNSDDIARRSPPELLTMLRDGLDQPPLSVKLRLAMEAVLDLLGEQDLGKRMAMREQIQTYLVETWGEWPWRTSGPRREAFGGRWRVGSPASSRLGPASA